MWLWQLKQMLLTAELICIFNFLGAGEMAPWLGALAALLEEFHPKYPCSSSQLSATPPPQYAVPFSGLSEYQACTWHTDICSGKILIHINKFFLMLA